MRSVPGQRRHRPLQCLCIVHVILKSGEGHLGLDHPTLSKMSCCSCCRRLVSAQKRTRQSASKRRSRQRSARSKKRWLSNEISEKVDERGFSLGWPRTQPRSGRFCTFSLGGEAFVIADVFARTNPRHVPYERLGGNGRRDAEHVSGAPAVGRSNDRGV
jgi:hypothetical protein